MRIEGLSFLDTTDGLEAVDLDLDSEVKKTYCNILEYYKISKKLPSLTYLNDDLKKLYEEFIGAYIKSLNNIARRFLFNSI